MYNVSKKSSRSVCNKITQTTGDVGGAVAYPTFSKLGTFLLWALALSLSMPIYSNLQINGASGETLTPPDSLFCFKNRGSPLKNLLGLYNLNGPLALVVRFLIPQMCAYNPSGPL